MKKTYINGKIYTGDGWAEGFTVVDDRFGEVFEKNVKHEAEGEVVDLQGKFVCAGFNDSHMHLLNLGNKLSNAELTEHTSSLREMLDYLKEYIRENHPPKGCWIKGRGFNHDYFRDEKRFPNRYDLDEVSTEHPICLVRACGHICVVNSKGLEMIGVDRNTPQVEGGSFLKDEQGEPLGIFFENALELVYKKFPVLSVEELKSLIVKGCQRLNAYGITSCQSDDYETFPNVGYLAVMQAFEELEKEEKLTVRVNEQAQFTNLPALQAYVEREDHVRGNANFKNGPLKLVGDGSLGARTAYLSRPYADAPETCGIPIYTPRQLKEMCSYANRHGMQIAIHAIGDGILDDILDAYENALKEYPREDHRHGIVHCQITREDQIQRMKELGLHVYLQSIFLDYDIHIVRERVGEELAASSYQAASLMKNGITISNGSDSPVEDAAPVRGIQCGVTRQDLDGNAAPYLLEEALTVQEAIDSFTKYGAYASFEEKEKGCIRTGMLADFVVLEENPFEVPVSEIRQIQVAETYLGGKKVYENQSK